MSLDLLHPMTGKRISYLNDLPQIRQGYVFPRKIITPPPLKTKCFPSTQGMLTQTENLLKVF